MAAVVAVGVEIPRSTAVVPVLMSRTVTSGVRLV
jgi:hypothetical protein